MNRRGFLRLSGGVFGAACGHELRAWDDKPGQVMTVGGPIRTGELGVTLVHEHILVDFVGADKVSRDRYDTDEVFRVALPALKRAKELGCQSLVECTPAYLGRDPGLLKRLSQASGLQMLTNTGYYGAVNGKYLPSHAWRESADQLAARWVGEWKDGIDGTGVRPGFIKIGVDAGPLTDINCKLVQASARTHLKSGLTIAAHTGDGTAALAQLKILGEEGVAGSAFIWVHAQNERNTALHVRAAEQGAWVEFDGIGRQAIERHVELLQMMKGNGRLGRVLLSHDAGWYHVGEPGGGNYRPYDTLFTDFLPALKAAGFTAAEATQLTTDNPGDAFALRVRAKKNG
jgi:phosphotriesterase-related protein